MSRRGAGVSFCFIAAFLFATRYICAAIFGSNVSSWSSGLYSSMLGYIGNGLNTFAVISLIVGIIYLIASEFIEKDNDNDKELESIEINDNERGE
ncbi:hypothetical protein LGL55_16305 [Clostridium tagluense]|uniref:hypothetical protein n=1 Tax=Clostridium TaxID=1485 RepID=UPI0016524EB9|nr:MULTISPECIES: hypothetical protein [Clostridium]MBZ9623786.1 hypothetical protein [Clostridium sp. FP2]MCB2312763.1 hypothetical protein [Clostridium tagluense]MCB2317529.1 hypothetical protein [Clostridium tagluense]MCB2322381.1 hypothetical protein [Clostridium tagluense]MCB2327384.1 hypothetical protein [Clostridium tagluense]